MRSVIIVSLLLIFPLRIFSQSGNDIKKFENLFTVEKHKHKWGEMTANNRNEFTFIFSAFFVVYKEVLSSQDIDACVFTPSCSVYAIESIKKKGVISGYFSAIDRLTRCNPGRNKNLPIDAKTGKYFDPLE